MSIYALAWTFQVLVVAFRRHFAALGTAFVLAASMALAGCASVAPREPVPPVHVVPVPTQCPAPNVPEPPRLALERLAADAPAAEVLRTYAEALKECSAYSRRLRDLLEGYQ